MTETSQGDPEEVRPTRVCLYCGSNSGSSATYIEAARGLGAALAQRSITLVYGGGHVGLMGEAADAALAEGGQVIGVITEQLVRAEVAHEGITTLEVVDSMHARKMRMAELADGFIVMPGGFGTLDELAEMLTWNQLGIVVKPVVLLDVDGFWAPLYEWVDGVVDAGFIRPAHRMLMQRAATTDEAIAKATGPAPDVGHKWIDTDPSITGEIRRQEPS